MIKGYLKANDLDKVMEVYEKMRFSGIKANLTILTFIMDAFGRCKDFGSALSWYKEMESCGVTPDQKAKNVLLSLASSRDKLEESKELTGFRDETKQSLLDSTNLMMMSVVMRMNMKKTMMMVQEKLCCMIKNKKGLPIMLALRGENLWAYENY